MKSRKNKPCDQDTENLIRRVRKKIPRKPEQIGGQSNPAERAWGGWKDIGNNYQI